MTEAEQIAASRRPVTVGSLLPELRAAGIAAGDVVLVHASLRSLGWVNGGPVAVIQALLRAVGPGGTIVMPAHSADLTDPANWRAPPLPAAWIEQVRQTMPAYDPRVSPTRDMGRMAELFRTWPGASRSVHPFASFAALGPMAARITAGHDLHDPLGMGSPLGALYGIGAKSLLIGVDFDRCTCLHLAENIVWPDRRRVAEGAPLMVDGDRQWVAFEVPHSMDGTAFMPVGAAALRSGVASASPLGEGLAFVAGIRPLVDLAVAAWSGLPYDAFD